MKKIRIIFMLSLMCVPLMQGNEFIETTSGKIISKSYKNIQIFEDIPYAKPPIDQLRWKAPVSFIDTDTIIKSKDNNFCIQRPSSIGGAEGDNFYVGKEDCLYLDIFKPKKIPKNNSKLPVMFWIHGGGNTSGLKDLYDFSKMVSKHEVIVVRINYRLGPFGWFTHPSIQNFQSDENKTSNFGTLDIIMALEWVNQNISKFGGDNENITIFGESAGGHNVLSLLVSNKAKGLFHKAISMSGYTTSISIENAYKPQSTSSTSNYSSSSVIQKILSDSDIYKNTADLKEIREMLLQIPAEDFFRYYSERSSYEELPLLTADGIVIPKIGLRAALADPKYVNNVPTIAGSNRDEVKLWLGTAEYFVGLDYSFLGSVLNIPKVILKNEDAFDAFNFYRSAAWKIRGVDNPLDSLHKAGNKNLYAYRFDWDDHRRYVIANFQKLIGAAHATEIPLLAGNSKLVGGYPLSDLIYPPSFSKRYTSKNMMKFWSNFAKTGIPGYSTNSIKWEPYLSDENDNKFLIIDKKRFLRMESDSLSLGSLSAKLYKDNRVDEIEKCVILLQMYTFVGDDQYSKSYEEYPGKCDRKTSETFLKNNDSFIEY
tara:strand:- start:5526 stop:7313 length:1788 start_codon:yes stop_codon:yes gene_type:complete